MPRVEFELVELHYGGIVGLAGSTHELIPRPIVDVRLSFDGRLTRASALVDTGAVNTVASRSLADDLEIDVDSAPSYNVGFLRGGGESGVVDVDLTVRSDETVITQEVPVCFLQEGDLDSDFEMLLGFNPAGSLFRTCAVGISLPEYLLSLESIG